jgi:hypothetical protein
MTSWSFTATWRDRASSYHGQVRDWIDQKHEHYSFPVTRRALG